MFFFCACTDDRIEKTQCTNTAAKGDTVSLVVTGIDIEAMSTDADNTACGASYSDDDIVSLGDEDTAFMPMEVFSVPG